MKSANWISAIGRQAGQRQPDADADDRRLRERRVDARGRRRTPRAGRRWRGTRRRAGPTSSPRITTRSSAGQQLVLGLAHGVDDRCARSPPGGIGGAAGRGVDAAPAYTRGERRIPRVGRRRARRGLRLGRVAASSTSAFTSASMLLLRCSDSSRCSMMYCFIALQRVLLAPRLDLLGRAIGAVVVVRGVGEVAVRLALDEGRSLAPTGAADGGVHGGVDVERVVAVDDHAGEAVGVGVLGDVRRPPTPWPAAPRWRSRCSRRRRRIGSRWMPAKLSASWKSPFDVAPSPK